MVPTRSQAATGSTFQSKRAGLRLSLLKGSDTQVQRHSAKLFHLGLAVETKFPKTLPRKEIQHQN